jgi:hypothetical protein
VAAVEQVAGVAALAAAANDPDTAAAGTLAAEGTADAASPAAAAGANEPDLVAIGAVLGAAAPRGSGQPAEGQERAVTVTAQAAEAPSAPVSSVAAAKQPQSLISAAAAAAAEAGVTAAHANAGGKLARGPAAKKRKAAAVAVPEQGRKRPMRAAAAAAAVAIKLSNTTQVPDVVSSPSPGRALQEMQQNDQELAVHASSKHAQNSSQETEKQQEDATGPQERQAGTADKGGRICDRLVPRSHKAWLHVTAPHQG